MIVLTLVCCSVYAGCCPSMALGPAARRNHADSAYENQNQKPRSEIATHVW